MKEGIHPEYKAATITCACGNVTETRSTVQNIHVEICSQCHPFLRVNGNLWTRPVAWRNLSGNTALKTDSSAEGLRAACDRLGGSPVKKGQRAGRIPLPFFIVIRAEKHDRV